MTGHDASHGHDTGGVPWHGRELTDNPFSDDRGEVDPRLAAALDGDVDDESLMSAVWAARGDARQAAVRSAIGAAVATLFVVAVLLVFTALQMHLVAEAFARGDVHPPILGNATVQTSRMTRG